MSDLVICFVGFQIVDFNLGYEYHRYPKKLFFQLFHFLLRINYLHFYAHVFLGLPNDFFMKIEFELLMLNEISFDAILDVAKLRSEVLYDGLYEQLITFLTLVDFFT